jgi:hypothetical protein
MLGKFLGDSYMSRLCLGSFPLPRETQSIVLHPLFTLDGNEEWSL